MAPLGMTMITRRAILSGVAASAGLLAARGSADVFQEAKARAAQPGPLKLKGRIKQSVCRWCYSKQSLEDLARASAEMGIQGIDLIDTPADWDIARKYGLVPTLINGGHKIDPGINNKANHEKFEAEMHQRIDAAAANGIPNVIVLSGNRHGMPDQEGADNCVLFLSKVKAHAEDKGVMLVMELLNSKVNHKDYLCDHTSWGAAVVKRVNSPRVKLLYDIYHMQIMEGDVIRTIKENIQHIGHFHTGGNPGRNEIDETQELYYPAIMRAIVETGYTGYVAHEFVPKRDPFTSLREAVLLCDV
jgi:hydroxypyruvate isomerase